MSSMNMTEEIVNILHDNYHMNIDKKIMKYCAEVEL